VQLWSHVWTIVYIRRTKMSSISFLAHLKLFVHYLIEEYLCNLISIFNEFASLVK